MWPACLTPQGCKRLHLALWPMLLRLIAWDLLPIRWLPLPLLLAIPPLLPRRLLLLLFRFRLLPIHGDSDGWLLHQQLCDAQAQLAQVAQQPAKAALCLHAAAGSSRPSAQGCRC